MGCSVDLYTRSEFPVPRHVDFIERHIFLFLGSIPHTIFFVFYQLHAITKNTKDLNLKCPSILSLFGLVYLAGDRSSGSEK